MTWRSGDDKWRNGEGSVEILMEMMKAMKRWNLKER